MAKLCRQCERRAGAAATVLALALATPILRAQEGALGTGGIKGTVRDSVGLGIAGVEITLAGSSFKAETDEKGVFQLARVPAGPLELRFRRLGYRPDTVELMVLAGKTIPLDVTLARVALDLAPVVVYGRANLTGWRAGFYARRDLGVGHFFTREDFEKRNPTHLTDMFRMIPGARISPNPRGLIQNQVRFRGARCAPLVWLDGAPLAAGEFDLDAISPRSLEAMEVYAGLAMAPPQFRVSPAIASACGTVLLWSREGELRPRKPKASKLSPAASLASLVESKQVFTASEVDRPAQQDTARPVRPIYPDALYDAGIGGLVLAEFVVDSDGSVNMDSFSVILATHPAFADAVQRALAEAVYMPAIKKGYPVQQVVQHEFRFVPDSTARRGR
ncbi:MAG TPA: carboxypeptidase regulatory-like domain-containing protein [Gemmatimonadaceae bacterium]|nr:carboxypeptidase regulatory-like domain-containing protein [Gemmatimonadaceae bacterium]